MIYIKIIIVFFIPVLVAGCVVYYPQTVDIPLINNKKDMRIDGGITILPLTGYSTFSYGITNHLAVQANGSLGGKRRYNVHGAFGLFNSFENNTVLELYGGIGYGSVNGTWILPGYESTTDFLLSGHYNLTFAQLNYGKSVQKHLDKRIGIDYGAGIKAGLLSAEEKTSEVSWDNSTYYKQESFVLEPTVFFSIGSDKIMMTARLSGCYRYELTMPSKDLHYSIINLGLGMRFNL